MAAIKNASKATQTTYGKVPMMRKPRPFIFFFALAFFSSLVLVPKAEPAELEVSASIGKGVETNAVDQNRRREVEVSPSQTDQDDGEGEEDNCE